SKKRGRALRGFRGVGRLSGLGYCQALVFRSRSLGDRKVSEIIWDGRKLKDLLRGNDHDKDLVQVIKEISSLRLLPSQGTSEHFFEVELRGVTRVKNDVLLDSDAIRSYLS